MTFQGHPVGTSLTLRATARGLNAEGEAALATMEGIWARCFDRMDGNLNPKRTKDTQ